MRTRLQAARRAQGRTATWICRATGIDRSRYSRLESGQMAPTDDELSAIAFLLGVDAERLREPKVVDNADN